MNGEVLNARVVLSNADPKRSLLRLVEPNHLEEELPAEGGGGEERGCRVQGQSRAERTARLHRDPRQGAGPSSRCALQDMPLGGLPGAGLGRRQVRGDVSGALHVLRASLCDGLQHRAGGEAQPGVVRAVRSLPPPGLGLGHRAGHLREALHRHPSASTPRTSPTPSSTTSSYRPGTWRRSYT